MPKKPKGRRSQGGEYVDRRILHFVKDYGQYNDLRDTDAVVQFVKSCDRQYDRLPILALQRTVLKCIPMAKKLLESGGDSKSPVKSSGDTSDPDQSGDDNESDPSDVEVVDRPSSNNLNNALANRYKQAASAQSSQQSTPKTTQPTGAPSPANAKAKAVQSPAPSNPKGPKEPEPTLYEQIESVSESVRPSLSVSEIAPSATSPPSIVVDTKPTNTKKRPLEAVTTDGKDQPQQQQQAPKEGPVRRAKRARTEDGTKSVAATQPTIRYADLGGIEHQLQEIRELIEYPLTHPEIYVHLGVEPARGILLHGPPGCGKTMLANAIAGELGVPFLKISAPEVVSGMSGESEAKLRSLFEDAAKQAPCIVFIDEIDAITPKRETAQREMERRIVAQLLTCMDDLCLEKTGGKPVLVIGATNRPDSLDAALRRAGRFDREISMGIPDEASRVRIMEVISQKLRLSGDFDFHDIAKKTPGFVGADLNALTKEAAIIAVNRIFADILRPTPQSPAAAAADQPQQSSPTAETSTTAFSLNPKLRREEEKKKELEERAVISDILRARGQPLTEEQLGSLSISMDDFHKAIPKVQPSSKREGFATIPDVSWADIGALEDVREELTLAILEPIRCPEKFTALGLNPSTGVLLYGPPGCGKTLLAKAIANESGANFISIKGPELLNKYVGESERAVRQVFARGRASSPCVIFFDELDAICPRRSNDASSSQNTERVVNQLLTEMDGLETRKQVFVIAATNRPDIIDPAMLRPGRLDKLLYVPLPGPESRFSILRTITRHTPLHPEIDLLHVASDPRCEGFSGADLAGLVREAAVCTLKEILQHDRKSALHQIRSTPFTFNAAAISGAGSSSTPSLAVPMDEEEGAASKPQVSYVTKHHFELAFTKIFPSVSRTDQRQYNQMQHKLRRARSHMKKDEEQTETPAEAAPSEPSEKQPAAPAASS